MMNGITFWGGVTPIKKQRFIYILWVFMHKTSLVMLLRFWWVTVSPIEYAIMEILFPLVSTHFLSLSCPLTEGNIFSWLWIELAKPQAGGSPCRLLSEVLEMIMFILQVLPEACASGVKYLHPYRKSQNWLMK